MSWNSLTDYNKRDNRIKSLGKDQRIALARVVSDLIMSDKIIDDKEVETFANIFGESNNRELFLLAQRISFAQALKLLVQPLDETSNGANSYNRSVRNHNANTAVQIVEDIANSDGFCAPGEALVLLAIDYFLKKNDATYTKYDIQSFRLTDLFIGRSFILYADMSNNSQSLIIEQNYDLICNLLASIGIQFIYIPKLAEQFKKRGVEMFQAMSMYIFPDIHRDKVIDIYDKIKDMTTKEFISKYLNEKLGFKMVCPKPSLYVMIGHSSVLGKDLSKKGLAYETYANFLKINVEDNNILDIISQFVVDYNLKTSYNLHVDFNPSRDKLLYHGFHKAFFRLVALAKENPDKYEINIDTVLSSIFINDKKIQLQPGIVAIYAMIICYSLFGDKKGLPSKRIYENLPIDEQQKIQNVYEHICALMKNCDVLTRKASLYNTLHTRIPTIKAAIKDVTPNSIIGHVQIGVGDYIKTIIPPQVVTINKIPLVEDVVWNKLIQ